MVTVAELLKTAQDCMRAVYSRSNTIAYTPVDIQWAKLVTGIDPRKLSGYGLLGNFLSKYKQSHVPIGGVIVVCDYFEYKRAYKATSDGLQEIYSTKRDWYAMLDEISLALYGFRIKIEVPKELLDE